MYKLLIVAFVAVTDAAKLGPALKLRGGALELGPITSANVDGVLKVAAAVTAAGAITEKYAGVGETTLTKTFKGDVWSTNLVISIVTGVTTTVVYTMGASGFEAAKVGAVLWLLSVLMKLKDAGFDVSSLGNDPIETAVAALSMVLAFA